jgi:hypothetical protein
MVAGRGVNAAYTQIEFFFTASQRVPWLSEFALIE